MKRTLNTRPMRLRRAVTLVEAMVSLTLFTACAGGLGSAYVQMMKYTMRNSYEVLALSAAQSIMEQVQLLSYDDLEDTTTASFNVQLNGWNNVTNNAIVQSVAIPWAANTASFTNIGVNEGGPTLGILVDVNQTNLAGNTVIKTRAYMPFRINLTRTVESPAATNTTLRRVRVRLQFQSAIPGTMLANGGILYSATREIRILRSPAISY